MVISSLTPLLKTLSAVSLRHFYLKSTHCWFNCHIFLQFPRQSFHRNYWKSTENDFAYSAVFKNRSTKHGISTVLSTDEAELKDLFVTSSSVKSNPNAETSCLQLTSFSDEDLVEAVKCLVQQNDMNSALYHRNCTKLDQECLSRLPRWEWKISCRVLQALYSLKLFNQFDFPKKVMSHYSLQISNMNAQQLVEFSFFLNLNRCFPAELNAKEFESQVCLLWNDFSVNDIGVISMAFFKCQKAISDTALLEQLISTVKDNAATIKEITLSTVLKLIRKSNVDASKSLTSITLFDAFIDQIPRLNTKAIIQLVLVASTLNYFHHPTLEKAAQIFTKEMSTIRLKDLERFALSLYFSGFRSPTTDQFWSQVEIELVKSERQAEIRAYSRSLISLLVYFVTLGRYPTELFRTAFCPKNIEKTLSSSYVSVKREIPLLYHSIKIECPEYDGPMVPETLVNELDRKQNRPIFENKKGPMNYTDKFILQLLDDTRIILGGGNVAVISYLQPHFTTPDIVFCLGENRCVKEIEASSISHASVINDSSKKWFSIVPGTRNMFTRNNRCPSGILKMKLRQLNILGYETVLIPWFSYMYLEPKDRLKFLRSKIY